MPKKILKRTANLQNRSRRPADSQINFTFFKSKMFLSLVAIALIVISLAVISSMNNTQPTSSATLDGEYRIDTSSLKNDPSAQSVIKP